MYEHEEGQQRAELFEELVSRLVSREFATASIERDVLLNEHGMRVDFRITLPGQSVILVEVKAPYSSVRRSPTLQRLLDNLQKYSANSAVPPFEKLVIATTLRRDEKGIDLSKPRPFEITIWDMQDIAAKCLKTFGSAPATFSAADLQGFLHRLDQGTPPEPSGGPVLILPGLMLDPSFGYGPKHFDGIVVMADFCSFSKFVRASVNKPKLVSAIMARYYRESRNIIEQSGATLEKFIGDGILFFYHEGEGEDQPRLIDECLRQLVANAIKLAEEWSDHIDVTVKKQGMSLGAANGQLLVVSESEQAPRNHIVGDCINVAARLQASAGANNLVVTHSVRQLLTTSGSTFEGPKNKRLKNIGVVKTWQHTYAK